VAVDVATRKCVTTAQDFDSAQDFHSTVHQTVNCWRVQGSIHSGRWSCDRWASNPQPQSAEIERPDSAPL